MRFLGSNVTAEMGGTGAYLLQLKLFKYDGWEIDFIQWIIRKWYQL